MRYTVGLTGGIGSGKSTIADRFAARGIAVVDADVAAHRLTVPGGIAIAPIRDAFGDHFIDASGALDRAAMRALVFGDPDARRKLEAILHPLIRAACDRERDEATSPYVLLVVPLLFEAGDRAAAVQRTLVVACDEDVQIARVMKRSGAVRSGGARDHRDADAGRGAHRARRRRDRQQRSTGGDRRAGRAAAREVSRRGSAVRGLSARDRDTG